MPGDARNQHALLEVLACGDCLTTEELAERTTVRRKRISIATAALIRRGFAERVERGCFQITAGGRALLDSGERLTSGPRGPLSGELRRPKRTTLRDLFWRAMRIKRKFTLGDLLECAGADERGYANVLRYCRALERAGYLRRLPRREAGTALTSNGFARFQLLCDSGPAAPVYRVGKGDIYDPNLGEAIPVLRPEARP